MEVVIAELGGDCIQEAYKRRTVGLLRPPMTMVGAEVHFHIMFGMGPFLARM